jgi:hypothetical protein
MKLSLLHEATMLNTALDIVGLIPGAEAADAANALIHLKQGEYFQGAMSLLSMLPMVGDAVGKSAKLVGNNSVMLGKFLAQHGDKIGKYWPKVKAFVKRSKDFEPYMEHLDGIVRTMMAQRQQPSAQPRATSPQAQMVEAKKVTT